MIVTNIYANNTAYIVISPAQTWVTANWCYDDCWGVTPMGSYSPKPLAPPKNWRWFGVFRRVVDLPFDVAQVCVLLPLQRRLGFLSLAARRKQKRRRFLHALKASA